jgi:hypothetical protein
MKSILPFFASLQWLTHSGYNENNSNHHSAGRLNSWSDVKVVKTTSGRIKGHIATLPGAHNVSEYLGIRFGEDTGGENRFMKPEPYYGTGLIDASKFVRLDKTLLPLIHC